MMTTLPVTRPLANILPGGCVRPFPPHNCWDPRTWGVHGTPAPATTDAASQAAGMTVDGGR